MRKYFVAVLVLMTMISGYSQPRVRLLQGWEFYRGDLGGIWESVRPVGNGAPESAPSWTPVTLPHCFNRDDAVDPDGSYYQGPGWYRANLKIENPFKNGRTYLHFEGAGQKTEVYIYTTKVGSHTGGYDEWSVDITDAVSEFMSNKLYRSRFKETIPVSIRCDNSRDLEMIPSDLSDFNLYGGLYRYLNLEYTPPLSIADVKATATLSQSGQGILNVTTEFLNGEKKSEAELEIVLLDPTGIKIESYSSKVNPSSSHNWTTTIRKPSRWSPDSPALYTLSVTVQDDHTVKKKIGFRSFEFKEHGPFYLNGQRLLLRGSHRHEDHAGVGAAMTEAMMREEMVMMKDMGVNFIRLGHYQQSRIILDLCDSLGILVWEEIPWCRGGIGGDQYKEQARRMLTKMIEQHDEHPSVIIWGLGNENDWPGDFPEFDKNAIRTFMKELNDLAHATDPTRKTAIRRCDFCKDIVDVYSPSIWSGWYRGRYTEYKKESEEQAAKVTNFFHAEWGGDNHARRHAEDPENILAHIKTGTGSDERAGDASLYGGDERFAKDGDWSETYICNLIDWYLKEQETMPWLTGTAYWPFKDFSTPVRPDNPVPYVNQKGVVERDLTKKEAYYVFQSYWTTKPMVHIYGHTWPIRWGKNNEAKVVKVYSNCDEAELFVNGVSVGVKKRNSQDFPATGLRWNVPMQEGNYHFRVIARKGKVQVEDEITQYYQTATWNKPVKIKADIISEEDGFITVEGKLLDENNVLCLDARNWIMFSLAGDGELMDNLGTSSGSRKVQAYNGRAIIRVKANEGKNIVVIKSPGLPSELLNLNKKQATP